MTSEGIAFHQRRGGSLGRGVFVANTGSGSLRAVPKRKAA